MILSAHGLEPNGPIVADLCIVGAGPAGIALALQCAATGADVVVLESGGRRPDASSQVLCDGQVADPSLHAPANAFRRRGLGGSSTVWGGRCAPFDPVDFAPRPWLDAPTGWPIDHAALAPYWRHASALAEVGAFDYDAATAVPMGMRAMFPGFYNLAVSTDRIERFSRPTDFGAAYAASLDRNRHITLLLHAVCRQIVLEPDGRTVSHLEVATDGGSGFTVRARAVVLAAGGLEVPRLLLASRNQMPCGVGNQHDQVGRHYMCHLAGTMGVFTPAAAQPPFHGYERTPDGIYCRRRMSIEPWAQRARGIGNAIARLHHPRVSDASHRSGPLSAMYLARHTLPAEYTTRLANPGADECAMHVRNILRQPLRTAAFAASMLASRLLSDRKFPSVVVAPPNGRFTLDMHAEQLPNPESRITLTRDPDAYGVPKPRIDWRYLQADIRTVRGTLALIGNALSSGGHGALTLDPDTVESSILRDGAYGGHHLGTARMSADPRYGVVDSDCRVHGTTNLYVAGGAVFATSGQANPTLTILALALRLADHLAPAIMPAALRQVAPFLMARRVAVTSVG